jgi:hypothetical protein
VGESLTERANRLTAFCLLPTAFCLLACHDRKSRSLPRAQATEQCRRVIDSFGFEFEHRPGARMFGRSSTVSHDHLVARQLVQL